MSESSEVLPARYASLDIWRGIACLSVIVFHATGFRPAGNDSLIWWFTERLSLGVPLFFIISGYCIAASADATVRARAPVRDYFVKRVRRIFPPYWAMLASFALLLWTAESLDAGHLFGGHHGLLGAPSLSSLSAAQWIGTITLTEGWLPRFASGGHSGWLMEHAWTLGYEEQFYIVTGLLILVLGRRWMLGAAAVTVGVATCASVPPDLIAGWFLDGHWVLFAAGVGVFFHVKHAAGETRLVLPVACLTVLLFSVQHPTIGRPELRLPLELLIASVFGFLLAVLHRWDDRVMAMSVVQPLRWCGVRSYSIYLMHWPLSNLAANLTDANGSDSILWLLGTTVPLALALSIGVAAVFYDTVERRFVRAAPGAPTRARRKAFSTTGDHFAFDRGGATLVRLR